MKKEFTANILFLLSINLLVKPFYALAIDTSVQNTVGPESYGLFLALFNFIYIQQIFADFGLQNFNNRRISRDPASLAGIFSRTVASKLIFSVFFLFIIILNAFVFGYAEHFSGLLWWIICSQLTLSFILYLRTNISGSGRYFIDSIFSVVDKAVLIIILAYLLWISPPPEGFTIFHFVKAQFASLAISLLLCAAYIHFKLVRFWIKIDFNYTKEILIKSLPYALLVLLMGAYSRLDTIMLEKLVSDNALEAGKYASSFRLFDTFNNFSFLFAVLLFPMFSRMISRKESVSPLINWTLRLMSIACIYVLTISYFFGEEILSFFYSAQIDYSYTGSFFFLMLAAFAVSLNYIYGSLLTANGNLKILNTIAIGGFLLNLVLNFMLIPKIGAVGAAITTAATQMSVLIFQVFYSTKIFSLKFPGAIVLKMSIILFFLIFSSILLKGIISSQAGLIILLLALVTVLFAVGLKLLRKQDFMIMDQVEMHSKT